MISLCCRTDASQTLPSRNLSPIGDAESVTSALFGHASAPDGDLRGGERIVEQAKAGSDAPTLPQSVIVELVFGVVGIVVILATGHSLAAAFAAPMNPVLAAAVGIVVGGALGGLFGFRVTRPTFADRIRPFLSHFTSARPTAFNFALIGLAAALGEEALFRAAIQPVAGIVIASILFTLAHSIIADFRHPTAGKLAYAALAFGMGLALGVAYDRLGIAASMGIHFAFDTVTLILIRPLLPIREPARGAAG